MIYPFVMRGGDSLALFYGCHRSAEDGGCFELFCSTSADGGAQWVRHAEWVCRPHEISALGRAIHVHATRDARQAGPAAAYYWRVIGDAYAAGDGTVQADSEVSPHRRGHQRPFPAASLVSAWRAMASRRRVTGAFRSPGAHRASSTGSGRGGLRRSITSRQHPRTHDSAARDHVTI